MENHENRFVQECLECRFADSNGLEGVGINIEKHENRFADSERREESRWIVGARATRPRGVRDKENKRKGQCFL